MRKKDIAFARVSYENPFTRKNESTSGQVTARFSKDREEVRKSTNIGVYREYQLNLDAMAKDKAISLSDEGRKPEAVVELKKSASRLRQAGKDYDDERLLEKADAVEEQAAALEAEGMTKRQRKAMRTESFQMKTQQQNQ